MALVHKVKAWNSVVYDFPENGGGNLTIILSTLAVKDLVLTDG